MKGFGGLQQMMKQASQMQNRVKKIKEEFAQKEFEGSAGGGMVRVKVNGDHLVQEVKIQKEVMEEADMLEDLILVAVNDAIKLAQKTLDEQIDKVMGGVRLPGLF